MAIGLPSSSTEPVHQPVRGTRSIRIREHSVLYERTGVEHRRDAFAGGQVEHMYE